MLLGNSEIQIKNEILKIYFLHSIILLLLLYTFVQMSPALQERTPSVAKDVKPAAGPEYKAPNSLAHAVLRSSPANYQTMIDFYIRLLKAEITCAGPVITFLRYDYEHHRIGIISEPKAVSTEKGVLRTGLDHVSFGYKTLTDLARTYVGLRDHPDGPVLPLWTVNHGPTTSLYYRDPDGNKIELQVDNFDTPDEANAFMGGPEYVTNPIGTDFDADEWAAFILGKVNEDGSEGLSESEIRALKKRPDIGIRQELPANFF